MKPDDSSYKTARPWRGRIPRRSGGEFVPYRDGPYFARSIVGFHPTLLNLSPLGTIEHLVRYGLLCDEPLTAVPEHATPGVGFTTPVPECSTPGVGYTTPVPECSTPGVECSTPVPECSTPVPECSTPGVEYTTPVPEHATPADGCSTPVPEYATPGVECRAPVPECTTPAVVNPIRGDPDVAPTWRGVGLESEIDIVVSGMSGTVSKVTVSIPSISHAFPADVDMLLVGPGGASVVKQKSPDGPGF